MGQWLKRGGLVLSILGVLVYGTLRTSAGLEGVMDIRLYDESYYLCQGLFQPLTHWLADYSALYSLYYKGLSLFSDDAAALYYLSYRFWAFVLAGTVLILLVRFGASVWFALLWALASFSAQLNYPLWPKAGHLAMVGVAVGLLCLPKLKKHPLHGFLWIGGLCLLLAWCRPEFLVGCVFALGCASFVLTKRKPQMVFANLWIFIPWAISFIFISLWGLPWGGSGRGMVAFGQHFVHNWRNITGQGHTHFMYDWVNWRTQFKAVFGEANSLPEALLNHPVPFLQHIWFNVRYLVYNTLVYFCETLFPVRWLGLSILACTGSLWFLAEWASRWTATQKFADTIWDATKTYWLHVLCLGLPSLVAGLLFQPRPHYILPLFPIFLAGAGTLLSSFDFASLQPKYKKTAGIACVLAALILLPGANAFFALRGEGGQQATYPGGDDHFAIVTSKGLENRQKIKALQKISLPAGSPIFDGSTGVSAFLGQQVVQKGKIGFEMDYPRLADFPAFLQKEKITVVYVAETLQYDNFFTKNPGFQSFINQSNQPGWTRLNVLPGKDFVLIKNR